MKIMDSETRTFLSIVVMAAHMADALRGWVNEQTEFVETDGRSREYAVLVREEHNVYDYGLNPIAIVRMRRWVYVLTDTWIDGVYQMTIGFAPQANKVLYHVEPKRPGMSLPGVRPRLHIAEAASF